MSAPRGTLSQVIEVARWEFARFVKWRQQFVGFVLALVLGVGGSYVVKLVRGAGAKPVTVAVVNGDALGFALPTVDGITWEVGGIADTGAARAALAEERVRGVLVVHAADSAELLMQRDNQWHARVQDALAAGQRASALERLQLTPEQRELLDARIAVTERFLDPNAGRGRSARIAAMVMLFIALTALFSGFGTLFAGITGEKQSRVTEQMISMVTPQTWVDGKLLGLGAVALVGAVVLIVSGALVLVLAPLVLGRPAVPMPAITGDPGLLALIALVVALGTAMWFAFFAAIAATIDDPNNSARVMLLFIPMLPVFAAFMLVRAAETTVMQVMAIVPLTSMAALPIRLTLVDVPWWEPVLAVLLLALSAWAFRRAAGKVFALGMLMHGKEPSMRELARWIKEA